MLQIFFLGAAIWFIWKCVKAFRTQFAKRGGSLAAYKLGPAKNWALALAHPMAFQAISDGFADSELPVPTDDLATSLRPMALHQFGLRTDLNDNTVRQQLPELLRTRWWSLDLAALHADDDPRAAMAFACVRVAFFVRAAAMLGWLSADQQWTILNNNAVRARECFGSWHDFAHAYVQGRQQWVAHSRADALGSMLTHEAVDQWLADTKHPWNAWAWRTEPAQPLAQGAMASA